MMDKPTVQESINISRLTNRELYAAGYQHTDLCRQLALEVLADEVVRLQAEAKRPRRPRLGAAWDELTKETP